MSIYIYIYIYPPPCLQHELECLGSLHRCSDSISSLVFLNLRDYTPRYSNPSNPSNLSGTHKNQLKIRPAPKWSLKPFGCQTASQTTSFASHFRDQKKIVLSCGFWQGSEGWRHSQINEFSEMFCACFSKAI